MKTEPVVVIVGAVGTLVSALLAVGVAFGLDLTADQTAAVMGAVGAVSAIVLALVARSRVTPSPDGLKLLRPIDYAEVGENTNFPTESLSVTSASGPVTVKVHGNGGGSVTWGGPK